MKYVILVIALVLEQTFIMHHSTSIMIITVVAYALYDVKEEQTNTPPQ